MIYLNYLSLTSFNYIFSLFLKTYLLLQLVILIEQMAFALSPVQAMTRGSKAITWYVRFIPHLSS